MVRYNNGLIKEPQFFADVYSYFIRGGYFVILIENILNILTTGITLAFITFVSFFLDWNGIGNCQSEDTCGNFSSYVVYPTSFHNTFTNVCMFVFICIFFVYWVWTTSVLIREIIRYFKFKVYFKMIGIRTSEIKVLTWLDVVKKMIAYDPTLTPEIIVGSVMNKDNYLIAIVGSNLFKINPVYYTQTFLWLLNVGILNRIFSDQTNTKTNKTESKRITVDTNQLVTTMKVLAVLQFIFLPFTFTIMIVHYIVNLTTDIYTRRAYFGPKEWTIHAKLLFREYNELPHIFNQRISKSYEFASKYEQKFSAHLTNVLMEKLIFTLGTCLTLLVLLTFYNETLVLYIKLFDRTLIWYITILVTAITVARVAIVDTTSVDESAEEVMKKIAEHTHYFPTKWEGKCHTTNVLEDYKSLFKYKLSGIFLEIVSMIIIPYYMLKDLSNDIEIIASFIEDNTVYCEGIGHICKAGLSHHLSIYSTAIGGFGNDYELLIEDEKIERSIKNFSKYYESAILDIESGVTNTTTDQTVIPVANPIIKSSAILSRVQNKYVPPTQQSNNQNSQQKSNLLFSIESKDDDNAIL